jgi:hypothetical protein
MRQFWEGFEKRAAEGDKVLADNPYLKIKIRKKLKEDTDSVKRDAVVGGLAGLASGSGLGFLNYGFMGRKTPTARRIKDSAGVALRVGLPAAAIGALAGAANRLGKISQRNKSEREAADIERFMKGFPQ